MVAGGLVEGDQSTAAAYRLNLRTGRVTTEADLEVAVHDAAGARLGGRPLVLGGGNATEQATVQGLSPTGRWIVRGHLPGPRSDLVTATLGDRLVVIGGYNGVRSPAAVLMTSDGRHFSAVAHLPVPVRYPAVVASGGVIWVFGGEHNGRLVAVVQRIDVANRNARIVGRLPHPLGHSAAAAIAGGILIAGGRTSADAVTAQMWWWSTGDHSFHRAGQLPYPVADAGVVSNTGSAYLIGGETPRLTDRVVRLTAQ
jgi:N-acetylneuraminic acid mutarotase